MDVDAFELQQVLGPLPRERRNRTYQGGVTSILNLSFGIVKRVGYFLLWHFALGPYMLGDEIGGNNVIS